MNRRARKPTARRPAPAKRVLIAAAAVKKWMSSQHLVEKAKHHREFENGEAMDPAHWHVTTYSRSRIGYGPTYHIRKGREYGGSTFAASLHDPEFGVLVCALLNAYEAATGKDVAKAL